METIAIFSAIWTIFTGMVAALLIVYNRDRIISIIFILFIFASIAFYHTVFFTFSNLPMSLWVTTMGGNPFQKIALALVLAAALVCGLLSLPRLRLKEKWPELSIPVIALVLSLIGYSSQISGEDRQWWIDAGSHIAFIVLVIGLLTLAPADRRIEVPSFFVKVSSCLIILSVVVGFYEVASQRAWASYMRYDGLVVVRASGLMFNPNLFGGWLGILILLLSRAPGWGSAIFTRWRLVLMLLIGSGLFVSGSRSAAMCIVVSAVAAMVVDRHRSLAIARIYLVVGLGFTIPFIISLMSNDIAFKTLVLRWLDLPLAVAQAIMPSGALKILSDTYTSIAGEGSGLPVLRDALSSELSHKSELGNLMTAITGRITGELRDNGILATLDRGGPVALSGLVLIWVALFVFLTRTSIRSSPALRADMWALFAYLFVWSLSVRAFQVYPIWIFMAVGIVLLVRDGTSDQADKAIQ